MIKNQLKDLLPLRKRLPPATSLVTFESAARLGSFTAAAKELHVTQAAVSRQIKRIEEFVGAVLFLPVGRGKILSPEGRALLQSATQGLEHIARSIDQVKTYGTRRNFTISAPQSFVNRWLMPRLASFRHADPDVDIHFMTGELAIDPPEVRGSLTICFGDGKWPHLSTQLLLEMKVVPVCSPDYLDVQGQVENAADFLNHTLLDRASDEAFEIRWDKWFSGEGISETHIPRRLLFNNYDSTIHAALSGHGIALGLDELLIDHISQGSLVQPFKTQTSWPLRCHLIMPTPLDVTPEMHRFMQWITNEVGRSIESL